MDKDDISETPNNHNCLTCDNLTYWDSYICKIEKNNIKGGVNIDIEQSNDCNEYIKSVGDRDYCKGKECMFWCLECPYYPKDKFMI